MLARYVQLSAVVMVVALVTGFLVHHFAGTTSYTTACHFQMALPATSQVPSTDVLVFNRRVALDEVFRAPLGTVFAKAARDTGLPGSTIAGSQQVLPDSDSSFSVDVTYGDPTTAVKIANALCNRYVQQLTTDVNSELTSESSTWRGRLQNLQAQLDGLNRAAGRKPTALYFRNRQALTTALNRVSNFLALSLSSPQYEISVLAPAAGAALHSTKPAVGKSLIVAAGAGLLASFLLILAIETARGRREES
jgi:hypothetical protein